MKQNNKYLIVRPLDKNGNPIGETNLPTITASNRDEAWKMAQEIATQTGIAHFGVSRIKKNTITPSLIGIGIVLAIIAFVALTSFNCVCFTR